MFRPLSLEKLKTKLVTQSHLFGFLLLPLLSLSPLRLEFSSVGWDMWECGMMAECAQEEVILNLGRAGSLFLCWSVDNGAFTKHRSVT